VVGPARCIGRLGRHSGKPDRRSDVTFCSYFRWRSDVDVFGQNVVRHREFPPPLSGSSQKWGSYKSTSPHKRAAREKFRSIGYLPEAPKELTMRLSPRSAVAGVITLIVIAVWYFGARTELRMAQESTSQPSTHFSLDRAEADAYCLDHQGEGCLPQADVDKGDEKLALRGDR
jgi:hypothetical protein